MIAEQPLDRPRRPFWSWRLVAFLVAWPVIVTLVHGPGASELLSRWPLFFVAVAGAVVGNATAIGGGLIFVPYMILFEKLDPLEALRLALVVQAFGMTSGAVAWIRRGAVQGRHLVWLLVALLVGAFVGTVVLSPGPGLVKGIFGPVSIALGVLVWALAGVEARREEWPTTGLPLVVPTALLGGVLTSWIAIGAGEIMAALLMTVFGVRTDRAVALGVVLLSAASIALGAWYAALGLVRWEMAVVMIPGVVLGARLAPALAQRLPPRLLKRGFAIVAIVDGVLFTVQGLMA